MPFNLPMWSGSLRKNAKVVAPPPDPTPYEVPGPNEGSPYIPANYDYSDGILSNTGKHPYISPSRQEARWRDKDYVATGSRPSAEKPAADWHGYKTESWQRSQRDEIVENAIEGEPLGKFQARYHPALNPYWYRIPDQRVPRAPHEYSFQRPFDQGVLGERQLNGMHYSEATIGLTKNPSTSLKGMVPAIRRYSTYRLEPTEWGENTASVAARSGPPGAVFTSPASIFTYPSSFRLG